MQYSYLDIVDAYWMSDEEPISDIHKQIERFGTGETVGPADRWLDAGNDDNTCRHRWRIRIWHRYKPFDYSAANQHCYSHVQSFSIVSGLWSKTRTVDFRLQPVVKCRRSRDTNRTPLVVCKEQMSTVFCMDIWRAFLRLVVVPARFNITRYSVQHCCSSVIA